MDWRFRNILISYLMYYIFAITNFMNCVTLWTVLCIVAYVIIDDIWDSY
jgi:ABC-type iron transport system FetAB permease component